VSFTKSALGTDVISSYHLLTSRSAYTKKLYVILQLNYVTVLHKGPKSLLTEDNFNWH